MVENLPKMLKILVVCYIALVLVSIILIFPGVDPTDKKAVNDALSQLISTSGIDEDRLMMGSVWGEDVDVLSVEDTRQRSNSMTAHFVNASSIENTNSSSIAQLTTTKFIQTGDDKAQVQPNENPHLCCVGAN